MVDGIPLYGPLGDGGNVPTDLDACGGHASDGGNGGNYHYHMKPVTGAWPDPATPFTTTAGIGAGFPYTPGCLAGCVPDAFIGTLRQLGATEQTTYAACTASGTSQPAAESVSGTTAAAATTSATTTTTGAPAAAPTTSPTQPPSPTAAATTPSPIVATVAAGPSATASSPAIAPPALATVVLAVGCWALLALLQ